MWDFFHPGFAAAFPFWPSPVWQEAWACVLAQTPMPVPVVGHPSHPCPDTHGVRNRNFPINTSLSLFINQLPLPGLWISGNPHVRTRALTYGLQAQS